MPARTEHRHLFAWFRLPFTLARFSFIAHFHAAPPFYSPSLFRAVATSPFDRR
jgi:hypothetical protein